MGQDAADELAGLPVALGSDGAGVDDVEGACLIGRAEGDSLCRQPLGDGLAFVLIDLAAQGVNSCGDGHGDSFANFIVFLYFISNWGKNKEKNVNSSPFFVKSS